MNLVKNTYNNNVGRWYKTTEKPTPGSKCYLSINKKLNAEYRVSSKWADNINDKFYGYRLNIEYTGKKIEV